MRILTVIAAAAVSLSATTAPALAAEGAGEVMAVTETVTVSMAGQSGERTLAVGSKVFVGDLVASDGRGRVQLLFADGTRMILGANSSLMIDEFVFGGKAAENTTENRFAVRALAGRFRFVSGDSGDRGYSIRTPSARISVRGTAFDFTVTPDGTKLLLLEGEATLCSESDEGEDCKTVATPCALLQTEPGEDVEEIEAGKRRLQETSTQFPHLRSQSNLLEEFRVAAAPGCLKGGVAKFVIGGQTIRKVAGGLLAAAGIVGAAVLLSTTVSTNNNTN